MLNLKAATNFKFCKPRGPEGASAGKDGVNKKDFNAKLTSRMMG